MLGIFFLTLFYLFYFLFSIRFKKVDFLESQWTHVDFCCLILFSNATPFMFLFFFVFFSTSYTITIFLLCGFWFFFWFKTIFIIINYFYKIDSILLTIHLKHFDFIERFDLPFEVLILLFRLLVILFFCLILFLIFCMSLNSLTNDCILPIS